MKKGNEKKKKDCDFGAMLKKMGPNRMRMANNIYVFEEVYKVVLRAVVIMQIVNGCQYLDM